MNFRPTSPAVPPPRASRATPLAASTAFVLLALLLVPGVVGHEPWKPDEAYTFGLVHAMSRTGDWILPRLAGEPFVEKPPLFYALAALVSRLHRIAPLAEHDAARLATLACMVVAVVFVARAARALLGAGSGRWAAIGMTSCLGAVATEHALVTDVALLAGFAIALDGLARWPERPWSGGATYGGGVGVAFLSKGLVGPAALVLTLCALVCCPPHWRRRRLACGCTMAVLVALPFIVVWPTLLFVRAPEQFRIWLFDNNLGRFTGDSIATLGARQEPLLWIETLPWFLLPSALFIAATVRRGDAAILRRPVVVLPLAMLASTCAILAASASGRSVYALPLTAPIGLLVAGRIRAFGLRLDDVATRAAWWFAGALVIVAWSGWLAHRAGLLGPAADAGEPVEAPLLGALAVMAAVGAIRRRLSGVQGRSLASWATCVGLGWGLAMTLWLPVIDASKSYRPMLAAMAARLPPRRSCIASTGLGEPQRALLDYFQGIDTIRTEVADASACTVWLVQLRRNAAPPVVAADWKPVWEGRRWRDGDLFTLYVRDADAP